MHVASHTLQAGRTYSSNESSKRDVSQEQEQEEEDGQEDEEEDEDEEKEEEGEEGSDHNGQQEKRGEEMDMEDFIAGDDSDSKVGCHRCIGFHNCSHLFPRV